MKHDSSFNEALEAVEHLSPEAQAELISVVQRRLAERERKRLAANARSARAEFKKGALKARSSESVMREIRS